MNNIRIIKNGIDVHRVCEQLSIYSDDWYIQREGTDTLLERGYADIEVGNIQSVLDGDINIFINEYLKWRRQGLND